MGEKKEEEEEEQHIWPFFLPLFSFPSFLPFFPAFSFFFLFLLSTLGHFYYLGLLFEFIFMFSGS